MQLQKSGVMIREKQQEFAEKKGKKSAGGCCCKVLFSLFGVVKILSFMMIQAPLSSFQCPSSIQSLILALFNSVLGPKKILRISPANLGKNPSRGQESLLSTLDLQTGIS